MQVVIRIFMMFSIFMMLNCSSHDVEDKRNHTQSPNKQINNPDNPKNDDSKTDDTYTHPLNLSSCKNCHESKRPQPPHPTGDCIACHDTHGWAKVKSFSHEPMPTTCNSCHLDKRPVAPHPQEGDCVSCHTFPTFAKVKKFNHQPPPGSCNTCHAKIRPAAPHEPKKDCVDCHTYPSWEKVAKFNHTPKPSSCNTCHNKDRPKAPHVQTEDCASCHNNPDWKKVSFSHVPEPTNCERCHTRPSKTYARAYPNQTPPAGFNANNPKELGSGHLVGLDCKSCHRSPAAGVKAWNFNHDVPTVPYCLPCHSNNGRREHSPSNRYNFNGFGNCFNCHKDYRKSQGRSFDR